MIEDPVIASEIQLIRQVYALVIGNGNVLCSVKGHVTVCIISIILTGTRVIIYKGACGSCVGYLLLNLLSSLSVFQYHQTREKTLDGIRRGKIEGVYKGRKKGSVENPDKFLSKPKVRKILSMLHCGMSVRSISSVVECSPNTVLKIRKRISEGCRVDLN